MAVLLCACSSDGGGGDSLKALGIDDGASKGVSKSVSTNGDKNVRLSLETGALLDVPAGAVDKQVKLTLERPADAKALELVEKFKKDQDRIVSAPYVLTPHGTKFKEGVTVTLPLAKEGKRELSVAWLEDEDDTNWKLLGTAKTDGKKASVVVKHFSVLVIVEEASDLPSEGTISDPEADAGARADAGAEEAGSVEAGLDASQADAGIDAAIVDTGTPAAEASTGSVDAAVRDTGAPPPDANTSDASALASAQQAELMSCGFQAVNGSFSPGGLEGLLPYEGSYQLCIHNCYSNVGNCSDKRIYRCNLSSGVFSDALVACISSCPSPAFYCPGDTSTVVSYCDGTIECPNGVDENNCDPQLFFTCQGAERVAQTMRCDGFADCSNAQDEQGCFVCDGAAELLPPYKVCNGWYECEDHSDEPASCAQILCGPTE